MSFTFRKSDRIGNLDAESDSFLDECFVRSDVYNELLEFDKNHPSSGKRIIVGRTGSGKTALLKQLVKNAEIIKDSDEIEAETTIFEHIDNNVFITKLLKEGVDLRAFYKSLWIHVLLAKVIQLLYKDNEGFFESIKSAFQGRRRRNLQKAHEYSELYSDSFFNPEIVSEITERFSNDLSGTVDFSHVAGSISKKKEEVNKIQSTTTNYVSNELLVKQKELIHFICDDADDVDQKRIIISIDDLDKSWLSQSDVRYDFINALLEAFKEFINVRSVKILISIRSDILHGVYNHNLRQEEKDISYVFPIEWQKKEIREILDLRIQTLVRKRYESRAVVSFADIFNFSVKGQSADEFILERTMLRPRDAIDFVNLCLSHADGEVALSEDDVLDGEQQYYSSRKRALSDEWRSIYRFIDDYIDSVSLIQEKSFTVKSLNDGRYVDKVLEYLIEKTGHEDDKESVKIATDIKEIIKIWFVIGIVGYRVTDTRIVYSSYAQPRLDITDFSKKFVIHPLFFRY